MKISDVRASLYAHKLGQQFRPFELHGPFQPSELGITEKQQAMWEAYKAGIKDGRRTRRLK